MSIQSVQSQDLTIVSMSNLDVAFDLETQEIKKQAAPPTPKIQWESIVPVQSPTLEDQ